MSSPIRAIPAPPSLTAEAHSCESVSRLLINQLAPAECGQLTQPSKARSFAFGTASPEDLPPFGTPLHTRSQEFEKNRYRLTADQYLPQQHRKDLIVLHFTAGTSCESAYRTWAGNPERIATAYGVDPDGSIVEFFPPECWAFHLGVKGTRQHDQRSIGIEIANVGPLKPSSSKSNQLNWWPKDWGTPYCTLDRDDLYCRAPFRGIDYFAAMPLAQQDAVGTLVRHLCDRFSIPREASGQARSGDYNPALFESYSGVATHSNFRRDKWDVGPAFSWDRLGF